MFNLVKQVLSTHATPSEGKARNIDVKLVAIKLREMRMKINCTLQGNYFSKIDQKLARKYFSSEDTDDGTELEMDEKHTERITKLLMQDFSNMLTLKPSF